MKKKKMPFETKFWAGYEIKDPSELFDVFFDGDYVDAYKRKLGELMMYSRKAKVYDQKYPGRVFMMYTEFRSFVKACYVLQDKNRQWKVAEAVPLQSLLCQGTLSTEEYKDPFVVFKNAFAAQTLKEYDYFLCEMAHSSLSIHTDTCDTDLITPYICLIKMLDAAQLIRERKLPRPE